MRLVLDTETTGLLTKSRDWMAQPGICQIGAIKLAYGGWMNYGENGEVLSQGHGWREVDKFYTLVNPETSQWAEDAIKTHGITPEQVADAPTFFEIGPALSRFILGCDTWGGFNTPFDKEVVWHQLLKYGLERTFPWPPEEFDVMRVACRIMEQQGKRGMKNPTLEEAHKHFLGTGFDGAHDALSDVRATAAVWAAIEGEQNGSATD